MQNITSAVKASLREKIDSNNNGLMAHTSTGWRIPEWRFTLDRAKVAVRTTDSAYKVVRYENWRDATEDCEILAVLPRRYSQKKRNGQYPELMPRVPAIKV